MEFPNPANEQHEKLLTHNRNDSEDNILRSKHYDDNILSLRQTAVST